MTAKVRPTRSVVISALLVSLGLLVAEIGIVFQVRGALDRRSEVSDQRLLAAMQTFRPSERRGLARLVPAADLAPERSVRTEPSSCAPLSLLSTGRALDGASWSGVSGEPVEPVIILTVRFADAGRARAALREKRLALLRCHSVRLTFAPFDKPAREFAIAVGPTGFIPNQTSYGLVSGGERYEFYVRRWGNTLTWTYAKDVDRFRASRQVVDDLADRLAVLAQ